MKSESRRPARVDGSLGQHQARRSEELTQKTPKTQSAKPSRQERWRARNPLAAWAHSALRSAVKRGLVERLPCEVCGAEPADAHHPDYLRPLLVRFMCPRCHRAHHRGERKHGPR